MEEGTSSTDPGGQADAQATAPFILILPVRPSTQCALHKKLREIYCETHQTTICVSCAYNDHRPPNCKTVLLEDKTELDRKALRDLLPNITSTLNELQDKHDRATARQTEAEEIYEAEEQKIQAWREAMTEELEEECERLVKQLQDRLEQKIGEVNKVADSNSTSLSSTWSEPLDTLQAAASSSKKILDQLGQNIALGAAIADNSAATSDAIEAEKQDLLQSVKRARQFLTMTENDVVVPELLQLHEQLGLGLKVMAEVSSKDASTQSIEGVSDASMLKEELRTCKERLQTCEEEARTHRMGVEQLQKELSAVQSTGEAEAQCLREDNAFLQAELTLKTKDFELANKRAEEMKTDSIRTEILANQLQQEMKDLEGQVESSGQPEASPVVSNVRAACQDTESPALLELKRIAQSNSGWKKRVVRKDSVLKLTGDEVVVINGPWIRAAHDFLTDKTDITPGLVKSAAPSCDRGDYYCVNQELANLFEQYFGTFGKETGFLTSEKDEYFPDNLIVFLTKEGKTREEALKSELFHDYFDIDETFKIYYRRVNYSACALSKVQILGGPPLSPDKPIRHYLENTKVTLDDFSTLLFIWH